MFGYIFPDKPELKVKEFELFRAYYCGLCKTIGSECGQVARMGLNYDSSFLGMFLSSFKKEAEDIKIERCIVHPQQKKPVIKNSLEMKYAADMNILLAYYKLKDDLKDGKIVKSILPTAALYSAFKKAKIRNPDKSKIIADRINQLADIENSHCKSIDQAAEPFAKLTEEIFRYNILCKNPDTDKLLTWFGYNIGKWIYIIDAYDDIKEDIKNKNFNPILNQFCYNNENIDDFKNSICENIKFTLTYTLSEASKAFELMDIKKNKEIIDNIIYGGMYNKTLQIVNKRSCIKNEKSI